MGGICASGGACLGGAVEGVHRWGRRGLPKSDSLEQQQGSTWNATTPQHLAAQIVLWNVLIFFMRIYMALDAQLWLDNTILGSCCISTANRSEFEAR
jgi:hypothetical protein